jgi:hypothetical protein
MIKVPADKLAEAVKKYLIPGLIRSLSKGEQSVEKKTS